MLQAVGALIKYLEDFHNAFSLLGLAAGGIWTLKEFYLRRIADRKSLATQMFDKFKNHPHTILATRMLDWQRPFAIGEGANGQQLEFKSTSSELMSALRSDGGDVNFSETEVRVREIFDDFLTELEMLNSYITSGLLKMEDISPFLGYWADIIKRGEGIHRQPVSDQLMLYIKNYKYRGVEQLLAQVPPS